jgi:hypothetical protein
MSGVYINVYVSKQDQTEIEIKNQTLSTLQWAGFAVGISLDGWAAIGGSYCTVYLNRVCVFPPEDAVHTTLA